MITANNINHFYESEQVLFDINLKIKKGEFLALVGSSGSGKSTLLSILSTLLKPTSGELLFDDISYNKIKDINKFRRENVGFVFQFHYLIEYLSIEENILLASKDKKYLDELLEYLDIKALKDKLPNQISGGQRQRVAVARALINRPKVIFADEPTGNLDRKNSENVFKLLKDISKNGTTIITATHDLELSQLCDKRVKIVDGKL